MSYLVWKKSLPAKILSSFSLTAQRHKNIANRSDYQIDDTDKRAYSHILLLNPVGLLWTWHFRYGVYAISFPFSWQII